MIYLLEDDESIRKFVVYALGQTGLEAVGFEKPSDLYLALEKSVPQLILLDVMLPEEDGISVLKKLRRDIKTEKTPVIMLTAKSSEYDKVTGLDSGADDNITKPFGTMELISRIKAVLRRASGNKSAELRIGDIVMDTEKHTVTADGQNVALTLKEYSILMLLAENKGKVFTRDSLLSKIWGYDYDGENRTVDVHIKSLRTKLGKSGDKIETVRGVGYKISE